MNWELTVILGLAGTLGVVVWEYKRVADQLRKRLRDNERLKERARVRAQQLLNEARDRAVEIVREAKIMSGKQSQELERKLKLATARNLQDWEEALKKMTGEIEEETMRTVEIGTVGMERMVAQKIDEGYDKARLELERYKQEKKVKLDAQAVEIVKELGRKVLAKVIPAEEHKRLIMEALKEVEAENGF